MRPNHTRQTLDQPVEQDATHLQQASIAQPRYAWHLGVRSHEKLHVSVGDVSMRG
jgi:hypothetical protein